MKGLKTFCLTLFLVVCLFLLTACGYSKKIIGKWTYEKGHYTYTFNEDGTGDYNSVTFTYTLEKDKISILYDGNTVPFVTTITIDGDKLNVRDSDGKDNIYIKNK